MQENAKVSLYINKDEKLFFKANDKIYKAEEPKANTLSNYEMFCVKSNIDVNDEQSLGAHKVYVKTLTMLKEASRRKEELNLKWSQYHQKRKELDILESRLKNCV